MFFESRKKFFLDKKFLKLNKKIPSYMIPSKILIIKKFPRNINGKINRKKIFETAG